MADATTSTTDVSATDTTTATTTPEAGGQDTSTTAEPKNGLGEAGEKALKTERTARRDAEKKLNEALSRLQEIEDRDKSEQQKLAERAEAAEKSAAALSEQVLRFEVARDKGLEPKLAALLTGSKEEMEAKADLILEAANPKVDPSTFDGGVRTTSTDSAGLTPSQQHTQTLAQLFGRAQ